MGERAATTTHGVRVRPASCALYSRLCAALLAPRLTSLQVPLLQLAADVAAGMAHVHSRSIVHGDLTPANVLLRLHQPTDLGCTAKVAGAPRAAERSGTAPPARRGGPGSGKGSPSCVLLRPARRVRCGLRSRADFGLSWKLASGQEHVSDARQGTGLYIAPEVLHVGVMSKAADVFSFGMVLHEVRALLGARWKLIAAQVDALSCLACP